MVKLSLILLLLSLFLHAPPTTNSQSFIGVNYGELADNLPASESTARLLNSTTISKLRLYSTNPSILRSLAATNISVVVSASDALIPSLAADPAAAAAWISANVLPFPTISAISAGNELLTSADQSLSANLLPSMKNLRSAAPADIKISTVHSMAVLARSDPPSSAVFRSDLAPVLNPILQFLRDTDSPFMINPYPYFAYQSDPRAETLAFCLFQPNPGRIDSGSGVNYSNMFDAQVAAVRAALAAAGFAGVEVVVAETGWPYAGDLGEAGANLENARAYNGNLVAHLRAMAEPIDTFIFALYDEDLKPGPKSERSFGLFRTDLSPIYDAGLVIKSGGQVSPAMASPAAASPAAAPPPEKMAPPARVSPPADVCVRGSGGGTCGQPVVQNLPGNSDESNAGVRDTCWMVGMSSCYFFWLLLGEERVDWIYRMFSKICIFIYIIYYVNI